MNDSTPFETRLTDALGRYADRAPTDVDAESLVRSMATASGRTPIGRRRAFGQRGRLSAAIVIAVLVSIGGLAAFGGRLLQPAPSVIVSPSASEPALTPGTTSSTSPTPTAAPTPAAVLQWTAQDIGSQPGISGIWRVGDWFVAVGPQSSFGDDEHPDARFLRSRDGRTWESVAAPSRGMEVETGSVVDGVLWVVGKLGAPADTKRGIWTTRDGATWQRSAGVRGLDFGLGRVDAISQARGGWLALARRWIDPEAQDGFMLRSTDGVAWTRLPYPDVDGLSNIVGLVSDGDRWLMAIGRSVESDLVEALTSEDGVTWTAHPVATMEQGGPLRVSSRANDVSWGPHGFVIGGVRHEGEFPHPLAWWSPDGETWTSAKIDALPGLAGESPFEVVVGFDDGFLATGQRLQDAAGFFASPDGTNWAQVDDLSGGPLSSVNALAVSDDVFIAGGEDEVGAFVWAAPR